ncbi:MAG: glutathione S-transferase family protein [Paracoccaceae bacterium]
MLTLFHAPMSRSSRVVRLIHEMGISDWVQIVPVNIRRQDGSGDLDPANPHPEGKAPALLHDGVLITETSAIMLYLTGMFPAAGLGPQVGDADYGPYLAWLNWYNSMMEPALVCAAAGLEHPYLAATFRGPDQVTARIRAALDKGPWLLGERFSAADVLVHSPYAWFTEALPDDPLIRDWVARCQARPSVMQTRNFDLRLMAEAA